MKEPKDGSKTKAVLDLLLLHYNSNQPRVSPSMIMGYSNTHRFGACIHRLRTVYGYQIATHKINNIQYEYELISTTRISNNQPKSNNSNNTITNSNNSNNLVQLSILDCIN